MIARSSFILIRTSLRRIFTSLLIYFLYSLVKGDDLADGAPVEPMDLYLPSDPLEIISGDDQFARKIYHKNRSYLVEFFASWCGHCQDFAPRFRQFAVDVSRWNKTVGVAVVDCSVDANSRVCEQHDIEVYPVLKYFKYWSSSPQDGVIYNGSKHSANDISVGLAGLLRNEYKDKKHAGWPRLDPVSDDLTADHLWLDVRPGVDYLALVVDDENAKNLTAVRIALDFSNQRDEVAVEILTPNSSIAKTHSLVSPARLPGLILYKSDSPRPIYVSEHHMTREELQSKINSRAHLTQEGTLASTTQVTTQSPVVKQQTKPDRKRKPLFFVHKMDLLSSLRFIFYREVAKYKIIRGEKLKVLQDFLEIILRYFPQTHNERQFLIDLTSWANGFKLELSSDVWLSRLRLTQTKFGNPLPERDQWVVCNGTLPRFRGFPCSLWTLFHTITVHYYMDPRPKTSSPTPNQIVILMRDFIREIFGCADCAVNFQKETANLGEVKTARDTVLYLWKVHNSVNKRLKGSRSEDPLYPKLQFPMPNLCATCRDSTTNEWDEEAVLRFLVGYYYSNIKHYDVPEYYDSQEDRSGAGSGAGADVAAPASSSQSFFSNLDFSLCLGVWLITSFVVLFAFFAFMLKRRRRLCRSYVKLNKV